MLNLIRPNVERVNPHGLNTSFVSAPMPDNRYDRNMQDDMKEAIDLLFKFKSSLDKLHPDVLSIIENMLQNRTRY